MSAPLLPSGLPDRMGKENVQAFHASATLITHFLELGYQLVSPPLMEYAEATITYGSKDLLKESFRLLDPSSGETMTVRADMTPQVTRIASTVLAKSPRPLKLCYSGNVVRVKPDGLRSRRQYQQVGIEIFGADANGEATILAAITGALAKLDIANLQIDIALPGLMHHMVREVSATKQADVKHALRMRDTDALKKLGDTGLAQLVGTAGKASTSRGAISPFVPESHKPQLKQVDSLIAQAETLSGITAATIDALDESYGEYFSGVAFALFSGDCEIGRGGRYVTPKGEEAVGFTLYIEDILPLLAARNTTQG